MTYESDNPQFDHLINNLDSEEIPYKRQPELWHWTRFHAAPGDWRPVYKVEDGHPGLGPYWCSGYGEDYSIICAWMKPGTDVTVYWPEATHVTQDEEPSPIRFTDRFPKPDWWDDV